MKTFKIRSFRWAGCALMFLLFLNVGPAMALEQCTMTSSGLNAAMGSCDIADLDCFVALAEENQGCAGAIAWYYMLLNSPDNPQAVLNRFLAAVEYGYAGELTASVDAAYQVNQQEQNAASQTSTNEYPFGQGYGQ